MTRLTRTARTTTLPHAPRSADTIQREDVAYLAYLLFEQRGRVHGHDLEDWLEAERRLRVQRPRSRPSA